MSAGQAQWDEFPQIDWETLFHPTFAYRFFRQPLKLPDPAEIKAPSDVCTPLTAAWIADAAMLAYGGIGENRMDLLEFDELLDGVQLRGHRIGNWGPDVKSVKAFFAYNERFAILAFRGTRRINWVNSALDLAAFAAREELLSVPTAQDSAGATPASGGEVLVHAGFQFAFNTQWEDINFCLQSYRKRYPIAPIFFVGHSMGAAFATMAVARFNGGRAALYTFGSPRVGNKGFCERVRESADLGVFRFVNNRDLMTTVPPREKFFEHTCGLMQIGPDGNVTAGCEKNDPSPSGFEQMLHDAAVAVRDYMHKLPPPPELMDHAQRRYCYYLWRWARKEEAA